MASKKGMGTTIEVKKFASLDEIEQAAIKLKRRLEEVQKLDPNTVPYNDPRVNSAVDNFRNAVLEIYGPNSPEYQRARFFHMSTGPILRGTGDRELQENFASGIKRAVEAISNLIQGLDEKRADFGSDTTKRVREAFNGMDLHPGIAAVSASLYRNGHYRNAVLDASVALVKMVKDKSGLAGLDGAALMNTAFSKNKPTLAVNELKDQTDRDEQEGMMHLFVGAVLALRNPRAHGLNLDSAEVALEYIAFISMLAKRVDQAKRVP